MQQLTDLIRRYNGSLDAFRDIFRAYLGQKENLQTACSAFAVEIKATPRAVLAWYTGASIPDKRDRSRVVSKIKELIENADPSPAPAA